MAQTPFYSAVKTDLVTCFLVEFLSGCIEKPERVGGPHVAEPGEWFLNPTTTKEAKRTLGGHDGKDKIQKATRDGTHGVDSGTGSEVVERRGQIYQYIERAVSVQAPDNTRSWLYYTKWYLYSEKDNTWEPASSFEECEYPILENFWESAGKRLPPGCKEPDLDPAVSGHEVYYSNQTYRICEAEATTLMDGDAIVRAENARGIPNDGGAKMPESTELTNDGDTEAEVEEALPVTGTASQLEIDEEALSETTEGRDLFLPQGSSSDSTDSRASSIYEPGIPPATPPAEPVIHTEQTENAFPANGTVSPLDTMFSSFKRPSRVLGPGKQRTYKAPGTSTAPYSALRPGNIAGVSAPTGMDFRSTPTSLRDKDTMPFRRETNSLRQGAPKRKNGEARVKFYIPSYDKGISSRRRRQLMQAPPGMQLASWSEDPNIASPQAEDGATDVSMDEFIVPEPPMRTLHDFPEQDLTSDMLFG